MQSVEDPIHGLDEWILARAARAATPAATRAARAAAPAAAPTARAVASRPRHTGHVDEAEAARALVAAIATAPLVQSETEQEVDAQGSADAEPAEPAPPPSWPSLDQLVEAGLVERKKFNIAEIFMSLRRKSQVGLDGNAALAAAAAEAVRAADARFEWDERW